MQQTRSDLIAGMFHEELIFPHIAAESYETLLARMGEIALKSGLVKDSFVPALLSREALYPTGLHSEAMDFAIPHTDANHVIRPGVIVARLANPVPFGEMGSIDQTVNADYVFLLLLSNNGSQVALLQGLMELCSDKDIVRQLNEADNAQQMYRVITAFLQQRKDGEG